MAELGQVHRHEMSGVLHGLFRVRVFTQDDAHIYCLPEQVEDEVVGVIELVRRMYKTFGFERVHVELSTRPEKSIGSDAMWETAESALAAALERVELPYTLNPGDGAFYGPKIDFHIEDVMGRTWQCATCQLDFAMPERLDLDYVGEDNQRHRPVMIHRTVLGSLERFLGHPHRALRRRPACLAGAGAGGDSARGRSSRRVCPTKSSAPSILRGAASRSRSALRVGVQEDPRRRGDQGAVHAGGGRPRGRAALGDVAHPRQQGDPALGPVPRRRPRLRQGAARLRCSPAPEKPEGVRLALEPVVLFGYTAGLHKEEATLPTWRLVGAQVKP